jgi:DNA repair protein RadC
MLIDHSEFKGIRISTAKNIFDVLINIRKGLEPFEYDKEYFYVIGITRYNKIKYIDLVSIGSMTSTVANPLEIFRMAIHKASYCIIIAHNHPSGNLSPSEEDKKITKRIKEAGKIIGIQLMDHLIFSDEDFYSFANEGIL